MTYILSRRIRIIVPAEVIPQLHPVVVPQSSQTSQCPLTFIRIELQLLHWLPV